MVALELPVQVFEVRISPFWMQFASPYRCSLSWYTNSNQAVVRWSIFLGVQSATSRGKNVAFLRELFQSDSRFFEGWTSCSKSSCQWPLARFDQGNVRQVISSTDSHWRSMRLNNIIGSWRRKLPSLDKRFALWVAFRIRRVRHVGNLMHFLCTQEDGCGIALRAIYTYLPRSTSEGISPE